MSITVRRLVTGHDQNGRAQVTIDEDFGCVEWPGGVDLCPTAMHEEVVQENAVGQLKEELTRS